MKRLLIYTISSAYVNWLSSFEPNIMWAKAHNKFSRPYIGVVLEINGFYYFTPLTHKTTRWIEHQDHFVVGNYGSLCFNTMIPILRQCVNDVAKLVDFNGLKNNGAKSFNYLKLLTKEIRIINKKNNINSILKIAYKVYNFWSTLSIKSSYCCNFRLLENYAYAWKEMYYYKLLKIFIKKSINNYIL